ncbi:MAG: tachylectin-related carbohydrate-binding protein [Caulobacteraceae bacterium]
MGAQDGADLWLTSPEPKGYIGEGWGPGNFTQVFSGGEGVIYAVNQAGNLLWYRHLGFEDGVDRWLTSPDPEGQISEGWGPDNLVKVFSGGGGVIYAIDTAGKLLWYKHLGFQDGTDRWLTTPDPKGFIGEGWGPDNITQAFSAGNGVIYAINGAGALLWYRHLGFEDGVDRWLTSPDAKGHIGEGWGPSNLDRVFCGGGCGL